jgi:UDP-N-acetyl-2-amino-2-deoxyglucuronate dehydrogenase
MRAIKETGNELVAAVDKHDNVGVLDSYFPGCHFFTEFERFDRHIDKLRRSSELDYISICSPNYLHDAHIRFALRNKTHAICEKPLVLNPRNLETLREYENEYGKKVHTILQLRYQDTVAALKREFEGSQSRKANVTFSYITARGNWYDSSWKSDSTRSGGVVTNIGIHLFDMLQFIFGPVERSSVHVLESRAASGFLELEKARVRWFLSINERDLPSHVRAEKKTSYRSLVIDDKPRELSDGFTNLHTRSYQEILEGRGFGIDDALPAISLVASIRDATPALQTSEAHPLVCGPSGLQLERMQVEESDDERAIPQQQQQRQGPSVRSEIR